MGTPHARVAPCRAVPRRAPRSTAPLVGGCASGRRAVDHAPLPGAAAARAPLQRHAAAAAPLDAPARARGLPQTDAVCGAAADDANLFRRLAHRRGAEARRQLGAGMAPPPRAGTGGGAARDRARSSRARRHGQRHACTRVRSAVAGAARGGATAAPHARARRRCGGQRARVDGTFARAGGGDGSVTAFLARPSAMRHGARALKRVGRGTPPVAVRTALEQLARELPT
eukprot:2218099-Prymnesium_polylepis.1